MSHCETCTCNNAENKPVSMHYLYKTWNNIKNRLYNPNCKDYKNYGGRGINMYESWVHDYKSFSSYIIENLGERPIKYQLDRIDNDLGYIPDNLRWVDQKTNLANRIRNK